jgi:serine/threonine-protein kinase
LETHVSQSPTTSNCPNENTFAQLLEGSLPADERARLETHVEACAACDGALFELGRLLAAEAGGAAAPGERSAPARSRYTIASTLGAGGFGRVYDAYDALLGRRVALKFLFPSDASNDVAAQILGEARALATLSHPNIVQIYDVDIDGPSVFMAMELVEGETLATWLRSGVARSLDERLAIVRRVGEALATAHRAGILHRDVKPENVLLGRDGRVRLSDFGLACSVAAPPAYLAGTPAYWAPEVRAGAPASAQADQYAFARLARECVFGVPPDASENAPPAFGDAPPALWPVLQRGASWSPHARYPSMAELNQAIQEARHWDKSPHVAAAAALQLVMSLGYLALSTFAIWALFSDEEPEAAALPFNWAASDVHRVVAEVDAGAFVYHAVGALLVVLLVSGWMPLAVVWGAVNAWALRKRRRWARTSTLAYAALSLPTVLGTPAGVYLVYAMLRARRAE